jgi:hypothetical protein
MLSEMADLLKLVWKDRRNGFNGAKLGVVFSPWMSTADKRIAMGWWLGVSEWTVRDLKFFGPGYEVSRPKKGVIYFESQFEDWAYAYPRLRRALSPGRVRVFLTVWRSRIKMRWLDFVLTTKKFWSKW